MLTAEMVGAAEENFELDFRDDAECGVLDERCGCQQQDDARHL